MTLPQLPADKANHVVYGLVIFCLFGLVSPLVGLLAAVVFGAAKEMRDSYTGKGNPELLDFFATAAGGAVGFLCTFL